MNIYLSDERTVRVEWPSYDAAIEAEIVNRLKSVPGIEGHGRRYYAPTVQVYRLMELFPKASYQYEALAAADGLAQAFWAMLVRFDLELIFDESGAICAVGAGVSPLIQQLVDERSHALRPLVVAALANPKPKAQSVAPLQGPQSVEDGKWETWLTGVHNAAKKVEDEKVKYPKRRRKGKAKQGVLGV